MARTRTSAHPPAASKRLHGGRREKHKADVRDRLVRAAITQFATRGFTATTVEDITRAADVAKGTFFNYFPTKELLLTDLMERRLEVFRSCRTEASAGRLESREVLRRLFIELMAEPGGSREIARCVILAALSGGPFEDVVQQIMTQGQAILSETMTIAQRRGEIRDDRSPDVLARLFQQSFYGVLYLQALHPHLKLDRCLDETFDLFWKGIEPLTVRSKPSAKRSS